jgi:ABC-type multidrug transport system ATPase subunit
MNAVLEQPILAAPPAAALDVPAIEAHGLTKRYGTLTAVNNLDLSIPQGAIFGFLGPNGSGKTTTIRMLLGLVAPTSGTARILGHDVRTERAQILPQVGAIVESPTFYPYLSGRDNLRHHTMLLGVPESRIEEVLDLVELRDRARDKVGTYSLGMKQRLGIAGALLNKPRIIFLDEPTNGLDPQGTVDVRNLILRLGQSGQTVFLSSHLLHEVEQVCTNVAIITHGTVRVQDSVQALLRGRNKVIMEVNPVSTAVQVLAKGLGRDAQPAGPRRLAVDLEGEQIADAIQALTDAGVRIYAVAPQQASLEDYFLEITGTPAADASAAGGAERAAA